MTLDTMHDVLRRRQRQDFTGREAPLLHFQENLALPTDAPQKRFIYCVSGQGGVGKTWLLGKFEEALQKIKSISAWTNEAEADVVSVLAAFSRQFEAKSMSLRTFQKRYDEYMQKRQEVEKLPDAPKGLSAFLGKGLAKAGVLLAKQVPGASLAVDLLDEKEIANQAGAAATFLEGKIRNKQDRSLLLDPIEALTTAFLADLRRISRKHTIALFFDTFERTSPFLESWLFRILERRYGGVPANLLLVFGGREPLSFDRWTAFEPLIFRVSLEPFTRSEIEAYLQKKGIVEHAVVEQIERTTSGLPLLVATVAAQGVGVATQVADPSELAVDRILKWIEDPGKRQLALNASAPRYFDREVISVVLREGDLGGMFAWLISMPFSVQRAEHWTLHEVARTQARRFCSKNMPAEWRALHERLALHYEKMVPNPLQAFGGDWFESRWQGFLLELVYHRLNQSGGEYLPFALRCYARAWDVGGELVRKLGDVFLEAGRDTGNSALDGWGKKVQAAAVAIEHENAQGCIEALSDLLAADGGLVNADKAAILHWRAQNQSALGRFDSAEADLDAAMKLCPEDALLWVERSSVRTAKEMPNADADISRALELRPDNDFLKMYLAFKAASTEVSGQFVEEPDISLASGEYSVSRSEEELLRPRRARRFLDEFAKRALLAVVRILYATGGKARVYEILRGADELLPKDPYVLAERGRLYWMLGSRQQALADLTKALEVKANHVIALCSRSLLLREMGLETQALEDEQQFQKIAAQNPAAHRHRARVLLGVRRYEEALTDLDLLVEFQPGVAKWHVDKAELLQSLGDFERALREYEQASELEELGQREMLGRASCLLYLRRAEDALSALDLLVEKNPKAAKVLERRAQALTELRHYERAVQDLSQARKIQPSLVSLNTMGLAYSYAGQFAAAVKCYQEDLTHEPNAPASMYNLAVVMARWRGFPGASGFVERAQQALERYERTQDFGRADYGYGGLEAVRGNRAAALQRLESAIALEPAALGWARHDIAWSELRGEPGFEALLRRS